MQYETSVREVADFAERFGFPDDPGFSLENSHFYLDDYRYSSFCVAMQRARQCGFSGATQAELLSAWREQHIDLCREVRK